MEFRRRSEALALMSALLSLGGCKPEVHPRFAYVPNGSDGTLSIYSIDADTGAMRARGYALTGTVPRGLALGSGGRSVYVADETSNDVAAYVADPATGQLSPVPGSPFPAGTGPYSIAVDPTGSFAYVSNDGSDDISAFAIDPVSSALSPVAGSPFPAGHVPRTVVAHPSQGLLYVLNENVSTTPEVTAGSVSAYRIDPASGALVPVAGSPFAVGVSPVAMALDPSGGFLYVLNSGLNVVSTLSAFAVDPLSGGLTPVNGSPFPADTDASALAIGGSGQFLYVAHDASNTIATYQILASGAVLQTPLVAVAGNAPDALTVDPSGAFLYAVNLISSDVSVFAITPATGALTQSSTVRARSHPTAIAVSAGAAPVTYTPRTLYGASSSGIEAFSISPGSGALAELAASPFSPGIAYDAVTSDPEGRFCYAAASGFNAVSAFTSDPSTGALTAVAGSPFPAGGAPSAVSTDPSGRFVYVANSASNDVSAFAIDPGTGALSPIAGSPYPTGQAPYTLSIDPTGRFLYAGSYVSSNITAFSIDPRTGALTPVSGSPFPGPSNPGPPFPRQWGSTVDPSGRFAYFTSPTSVFAYAIDGGSGALTAIAGSPFPTGNSALGISASPSGGFAYVGAYDHALGNYAAFGYAIGAGGALAPLAGSPFSAGPGPFEIAYSGVIDASGRFLYLATDFDQTIVAYALDPATGALAPVAGSPFPTRLDVVALTATATVQ